MTKYISLEQKEIKKTIFTAISNIGEGWVETEILPENFDKVVYLGNCHTDGDMFACYSSGICGNYIHICKGIKGDEF